MENQENTIKFNDASEKQRLKKTKEKIWTTNFILLFQGQLVSIFGNIIYDTAFKMWILTATNSVSLMSILMAVTVIPEVLVAPFAGTFSDRHDRRKILCIADGISGICVLFVGIAAVLGVLNVWMLVLVGIIVGLCNSIFNPTIDSTIPDIVPKSNLMKANSVFSSMSTGNELIGYAFGGVLVQIFGAPIIFIFNGISFLLSSISEFFIKIPKSEVIEQQSTFLEDLKAGTRFVLGSKGLKYLFVIISFLNLCASMSMTLTLPWFQENKSLGVISYGIAMAVNTFGMLVGFSSLSVIEIKSEKKFKLFIISGITIAITMIIYALTLNFWIICFLFFINGICLAIINSLIQTGMQNYVPSNMRAKIFAFKRAISSALMPIGMVFAGILASKININYIILTDYILFLILCIFIIFIAQLKDVINS